MAVLSFVLSLLMSGAVVPVHFNGFQMPEVLL